MWCLWYVQILLFVYSLSLYVMRFSGNVAAGLIDVHYVTSLSNIHACCPCITRAAIVNCPTI